MPHIGQVDKPQVAEVLPPQPPVVRESFAFELHAADTHAYPPVQTAKQVADSGERGGEVIRRAAYHLIDFRNGLLVQIMMSDGDFPNLGNLTGDHAAQG